MEKTSKKSNFKKLTLKRGISLITLVITIVVIIILAAAVILSLNNNNLIGNANKATVKNDISEAQSAYSIYVGDLIIEELDNVQGKGTIGKTSSNFVTTTGAGVEEIRNITLADIGVDSKNVEEISVLGNQVVGIKWKNKYYNKNAEVITEEEYANLIPTEKTLVQAFIDGDINVGDYLDYDDVSISANKVDIEASRSGYSDKQTYKVDSTTNWRVLGLNEDETELLLISGSPIKKEGDDPYLHLVSGEGYTYGEEVLNDISEIYYNSKYASEARSMKMEDITRALGITIDKENNMAYKTADETKTALPYQGVFGLSYTYKSGDYAPENYMGTGNKKVGDTVDGSAYMIPYTESSIVDQGSVLYEMLFKGTTDTDNYSKSYWLASPGVGTADDAVGFGLGAVNNGLAGFGSVLFYSFGPFGDYWMAVRPVVSLKSNITVDDIKVTTGSEATWTTSPGFGNGPLTKGQVSGSGPM